MMDFLKQDRDTLDKIEPQDKEKFDSELGSDSSYVTTASHEKRVKTGTIIFIAVFCVSLVVLWFMVKKATPQAAMASNNKDQDMQIENAIAKITGTKAEFFKGVDSVLGKFYEFSSFAQVKVQELKKNPFEHQKYSAAAMEDPMEAFGQRERAARQQLETEATGMQLLSIMSSPNGNSCMINDKILSKGENIDGWQITSITSNSVELSAGGMKKVLRISTD